MPLVLTDSLTPETRLTPDENLQIYCGLDSAVTVEILEELVSLGPLPSIYDFERALQGPYLEIMQRGFLVDQIARRAAADDLTAQIAHLQAVLTEISLAAWGKPVNPKSHQQLKALFYGHMKCKEIWISQKGTRKLSLNREVLEKLEEQYLYARPLIGCILAIRDLSKQLEVFETGIDSDGRHRTSYNIAGTETGRPSSSSNAYGTGGNMQNIAPALRYVFVADQGFKIGVIDLEQVEARDVGWFCGVLFQDWSYLDACESGDLHTNTAKLVWPDKPWPGTRQGDRLLADEIFYRGFSYRDMSKRGGHLTNYRGSAWMAARALKMPQEVMEEFQARYVLGRHARPGREAITPAYPCIARWWEWIARQIQTEHFLVNPFGRRRDFFGRTGEDSTIREAIAGLPQGTTADRANLGLWRVWKYMPQVRLLGQGFDSIIFQYPEELEAQVIPRALELIQDIVLVDPTSGRRYSVPGEAKVGWNWGYQTTQTDVDRVRLAGQKVPRLNLEGLVKWKPDKPDPRVRQTGLKRTMI